MGEVAKFLPRSETSPRPKIDLGEILAEPKVAPAPKETKNEHHLSRHKSSWQFYEKDRQRLRKQIEEAATPEEKKRLEKRLQNFEKTLGVLSDKQKQEEPGKMAKMEAIRKELNLPPSTEKSSLKDEMKRSQEAVQQLAKRKQQYELDKQFDPTVAVIESGRNARKLPPPPEPYGAMIMSESDRTPEARGFWGKLADTAKYLFNPQHRMIREAQKLEDKESNFDFVVNKEEKVGDKEKKHYAAELAAELKATKKALKVEEKMAPEPEIEGIIEEKPTDNVENATSRRLKEINDELNGLKEVVESIRIGWLSRLKIGANKKFTNLPGITPDLTISALTQEEKKLTAKGKKDKAEDVESQIIAFKQYTGLLAERDELENRGVYQGTTQPPGTIGGMWPGRWRGKEK